MVEWSSAARRWVMMYEVWCGAAGYASEDVTREQGVH
jgi:hypothetical protein